MRLAGLLPVNDPVRIGTHLANLDYFVKPTATQTSYLSDFTGLLPAFMVLWPTSNFVSAF